MSLNLAQGTFKTSHVAECPDVAPECSTIVIPPHLHRVSVGLTHYEIDASYGLRDGTQLSLRLPYDIKAMRVKYLTLQGAPYVPPYGDIHHRTETLTGISDPTMTIDWSAHTDWIFGAGTTFPLGHIVPDPVILGREGKTHEHIQFGSGTFMPDLSAQWSHIAGPSTVFARAEAKVSLYENREGFRAPTEVSWAAGPSFRVRGFAMGPRIQGQYQTVGRWSGEVDEGSGFNNAGVALQVSFPAYRGVVLSPGVYHEVHSHGAGGQTFHQQTTWSLSLTR